MQLKHILPLALLLITAVPATSQPLAQQDKESTIPATITTKPNKKTFGQKLLSPFKWIGRNWSAYDPRYSLPSFYNWAAHLQNTTSFEWLRLETPEGMDIQMRSNLSNRFGPYFGYQWFFYGFTIDLNTIGKPKSKGKNEFTLSINSNLMNVDIIRRRTGGDFSVKKMIVTDGRNGKFDIAEDAEDAHIGDIIKNSITGFNINVFTNHKKYSNPAAFSNGAVQLRSVGSPILGFGYTHQKVESDISELFTGIAGTFVAQIEDSPITEDDINRLENIWDQSPEQYYDILATYLDAGWPILRAFDDETNIVRTFLTNHFPTSTRIDDWHLQLGYAYNIVFSRRLLLGLSLIASPGIKHVQANNEGSTTYDMADHFSRLIQKHEGQYVAPDYFRYYYNDTHFNLNLFARASLTWNYNRWRAGLNASFSNYFYNNQGMRVSNGYGNLTAYVGYCFGRKKDYRFGGKLRDEYIKAALTKSQIEEMNDTAPEGNLSLATSYKQTQGETRRYHTDIFNIDIFGCDLVAGPDGRYGTYEIQDGYVTPGQDTEGRIKAGTVLDIDKNGIFQCEVGHNGSIRAGNWWKSQLSLNQTPNHWYPELLHYALRGKLTLYLRGRIFGTKKPVKLEIDDFCINHGKETQSFFQMGIKSFKSNSTFSIEGRAEINGRECRVYIEQKKRGKLTNMYVARVYESNATWMSNIDGRRPISTLSIPGTHDSGSADYPEQPVTVFRAGHTQNFSVPTQLEDGIRAFDIRLKRDLHYGHLTKCRGRFDSTMVAWDDFLTRHPSECIIALIGSDEGGKWEEELTTNYRNLIAQYPHRFIEDFSPSTPLDSVRGKILVLRRQEGCPYGKLLKFTDNSVFEYEGFHVEDLYKEHKTYRKIVAVEQHIREAYENDDPNKWYITFNSIAWSPRRHNPYSYAWGGKAKNIRKPMNKSLREFIELKDYTDFGIVFLDFYNDHGDNPQIVESIVSSNFHREDE